MAEQKELRALQLDDMYEYPLAGQVVIDDNDGSHKGEIFNDYTNNSAEGQYSHAEGRRTQATKTGAHAEGIQTLAGGDPGEEKGEASHAEGYNTVASGNYSHAEGNACQASDTDAHAEGSATTASKPNSHAEGSNTNAAARSAHAEGDYTRAEGEASHAEGIGDNTKKVTASGKASHAEGGKTTAYGNYSHAEGLKTLAHGNNSHAEGGSNSIYDSTGKDPLTVVQDHDNLADDEKFTCAFGSSSHAEGVGTLAVGSASHAENNKCIAKGESSHAEGRGSRAEGQGSHVEGWGTIATGENSHVQDKFNIEDTTTSYAHIVGNGSSDSNRSNAHTLDWSGNAWYAGGVTAEEKIIAKKDIEVQGDIYIGSGSEKTKLYIPSFLQDSIKIYYVDSSNTSSSEDGTEKNPFKSMNTFFEKCKSDGFQIHSCYIKGGTEYIVDKKYKYFMGWSLRIYNKTQNNVSIKFNSEPVFYNSIVVFGEADVKDNDEPINYGNLTIQSLKIKTTEAGTTTEAGAMSFSNSYLKLDENSIISASKLTMSYSHVSFNKATVPMLDFAGVTGRLVGLTISNIVEQRAFNFSYGCQIALSGQFKVPSPSAANSSGHTYVIVCSNSILTLTSTDDKQFAFPDGSGNSKYTHGIHAKFSSIFINQNGLKSIGQVATTPAKNADNEMPNVWITSNGTEPS